MLWDGRMDADKVEGWTQTNRKKESNSLDRETQFTAPFECYEIKKTLIYSDKDYIFINLSK